MVRHRGAPLRVAGLGPLRGCWEGWRRAVESVPWLVGIVEALDVGAVFMRKNAIVTCCDWEEKGNDPVSQQTPIPSF